MHRESHRDLIDHGDAIVAVRFRPELSRVDKPHVSHAPAGLCIYVGGGARVEMHGVEWTLEAGDVLIMPSGQRHQPLDVRDADVLGVAFAVHPWISCDDVLDPFDRVRDGGVPIARLPSNRQPFVDTLFRELEAVARRAVAPQLATRSLLALLIHEVAEVAPRTAMPGREPSIVAECLHYIERHCLEPLPLQRLAAALGRTPSYITTTLTRATGRSAGAWITAGRLAEARRRLQHSNESVTAIAKHVGYAAPTHFIRVFHRAHGLTPAAWRAARRSAALSD